MKMQPIRLLRRSLVLRYLWKKDNLSKHLPLQVCKDGLREKGG